MNEHTAENDAGWSLPKCGHLECADHPETCPDAPRTKVPEPTYVGGDRRARLLCVCGEGFRTKAAYKAHYRDRHGVIPSGMGQS